MTECSVSGCKKSVKASGLCAAHYERLRKHGDVKFTKFCRAENGLPKKFLDALPIDGKGCVLWPFATNGAGYGQVNVGGGRKVLAHRIACEMRNGPPPSEAHHAAHSCGNGHMGCVAPWHLSWKTATENNHDQDAHGTRSQGEKHHAILTVGDVLAIRADTASPQSALAGRFGISQAMISRIKTRKAWRAA